MGRPAIAGCAVLLHRSKSAGVVPAVLGAAAAEQAGTTFWAV